MPECRHVMLFVGRYKSIVTPVDSWFCQAYDVAQAKIVFERQREFMGWDWGQILVIEGKADILIERWQYDTNPKLGRSAQIWRVLYGS